MYNQKEQLQIFITLLLVLKHSRTSLRQTSAGPNNLSALWRFAQITLIQPNNNVLPIPKFIRFLCQYNSGTQKLVKTPFNGSILLNILQLLKLKFSKIDKRGSK